MFCPKCGKEINNDSNFCYNCGEKIEMQQFINTYKQNNEENKEQQFGNYQDPSNNSNKQGYYYAPVQNTSNNRSNDLFSKLKKSFAQHKKTYIIVISILVAIFIISRIISGVSSNNNNYYQNSELNSTSKSVQVPVYHTTIKVISSENLMFSIYDINIIIDDEKIGTINNGQSETYELELEEGEHTLVINSAEDKSVKGEIDFNIKGEDKLQFKAYSYSSSIDIKEQNFEEETTEGTIEETATKKATIEETTEDISKIEESDTQSTTEDTTTKKALAKDELELDRSSFYGNYKEVIDELKEMGFTNIVKKPVYDTKESFWGEVKLDEVTKVTINGKTNYSTGDVFKKNTKVCVYYHKYIYDDPNIKYTECTVKKLDDEMQKNAINAKEKYVDKYVSVTGYIDSVDENEICLKSDSSEWSIYIVSCKIKTDSQLKEAKKLSKGQKVTIKGKITGASDSFGSYYVMDIYKIVV